MGPDEKEEDLVLGEQSSAEGEEMELSEFMELRSHARSDIDTAIAAYNFLDEIDFESPAILNFGMKKQLLKAQKQCLQLLCNSINELSTD